jgi:hypothetical protein
LEGQCELESCGLSFCIIGYAWLHMTINSGGNHFNFTYIFWLINAHFMVFGTCCWFGCVIYGGEGSHRYIRILYSIPTCFGGEITKFAKVRGRNVRFPRLSMRTLWFLALVACLDVLLMAEKIYTAILGYCTACPLVLEEK